MWIETPAGARSLTLYFEDEDFNKPVTVLVSECMLFAMRAVMSDSAETRLEA
jgi:hypothetical protein